MATLKRIMKHVPATLIGLLVAAWLATPFGTYAVSFGLPLSTPQYAVGAAEGSMILNFQNGNRRTRFWWHPHETPFRLDGILGRYVSHGSLNRDSTAYYWQIQFPFVVLITAAAPAAIGPFNRFRFRLWHFLGYTALVALELAYYLRWQG